MKEIEKFSIFLFSKLKIVSNLQIQKILFLLRVYEKYHRISNSIIFNNNNNFQAWIYGPVNVTSYRLINNYLTELNHIPDSVLIQFNNKYQSKMKKYIYLSDQLRQYPSSYLVDLSHLNKAYLNVRKNLKQDEPCCKYIDELNDDFITFEDDDNQFMDVIKILQNKSF